MKPTDQESSPVMAVDLCNEEGAEDVDIVKVAIRTAMAAFTISTSSAPS